MAKVKKGVPFPELHKIVVDYARKASYEELDELHDELKHKLEYVEAKMQLKKEREYMRLKKQIDALGLSDEEKERAEAQEGIRQLQENVNI